MFIAWVLGGGRISFAIASGMAIGWITFVAWRGIRMLKASAIQGDRNYDRAGKFKLASEYHETMSATAAARKTNG